VNARLSRVDADGLRAVLGAPGGATEELPWTPADSIALIKLLNFTMGPSLEAGLVFEDLVETVGGVGARPLLPTGVGVKGIGLAFGVPGGVPEKSLRKGAVDPNPGVLSRARARLSGTVLRVGAWVISPEDSQSGSPLLAAEFNLTPTVPGLVYEAHLQTRGEDPVLDVMGATIPGLPVFWTGRNADVAWALTPSRVNTLQLYNETLREVGEHREYRSGSRWARVSVREEVIRVRALGGDFDEVPLVVESTGHGPIINGLVEQERDPVALEWTGAGRGDGLRSLMGLVHARSAEDLVARLADHREPALAVAYAGREGAVGWQLAGWLPQLALGSAHLPAPGRQRAFDWNDPLRYESLPNSRVAKEPARFVVVADNSLATGSAVRHIEWNWRNGTRSRRIERALTRLRGQDKIDLRGLAEMQTKLTLQLSPRVLQAIEALLSRGSKLSPEAREVLGMMRAWDGRFAPDRPGAAVYRVFVQDLTRKLLESKIEPSLVDRYLALEWVEPRVFVEAALFDAATVGRAGGWGDPELIAPLLGPSLHQAWVSLSYQRGPSRKRWNWGGLHHLSFQAFVGFDASSREKLWRFGGDDAYPGQGGGVGMADYDVTRPYGARSASLYRIAVDLAEDDRILTSLAPGQSEHAGLAHYRDGLRPWLNGHPRLFARSSFLVEENTVDLLRLEPGG